MALLRAAMMEGAVDSTKPKYQRLLEILEESIRRYGAPGDQLPSERELTAHFGVARMTLRHAIDSLVERGILERVVGVGTFVARPKMDLRVMLTSYSEEMQRRGMVPTARVLNFDEVSAHGALAREMELEEGAPVVRLRRLLLADGMPMSLDENYLPHHRVPGFLDEPAPKSLYGSLEARYGLVMDWGEDQIEATAARPADAQLLGVEAGSPLLKIQRHAYLARELVDYSVSYYRADRYKLWVPLQRPGTALARGQRS